MHIQTQGHHLYVPVHASMDCSRLTRCIQPEIGYTLSYPSATGPSAFRLLLFADPLVLCIVCSCGYHSSRPALNCTDRPTRRTNKPSRRCPIEGCLVSLSISIHLLRTVVGGLSSIQLFASRTLVTAENCVDPQARVRSDGEAVCLVIAATRHKTRTKLQMRLISVVL